MSEKYAWKRFWLPRGESYRASDSGFLMDPEGDSLGAMRSVVSFDEIATKPCLALLGEPGLGKSTVLKEVVEARRRRVSRVLSLDLRAYASEERLYRAIFESPEFVRWVDSNETLEVFLDSLDECLVYNRNAAALLADEFKKYPTSRLRLRIACRAADWPGLLDSELGAAWGPDMYEVFELLPLRRKDVCTAASDEGIPAEEFVNDLEAQAIVPLAVVPITLKFILGEYGKNRQFSCGRRELYENGVLALCTESSESRAAASSTGDLSPLQRFEIAEIVAASTVFGQCNSVVTSPRPTETRAAELHVDSLVAAGFTLTGGACLDASMVAEALGTSVFTLAGAQRRGWIHRTVADFLAGCWIQRQGLSGVQVRDLIMRPDADGAYSVTPELYDVAAWIAEADATVREWIAASDPEVLLRADLRQTSSAVREALCRSVLKRYDQGVAFDDFAFRKFYMRLDHEGIADTLRPFIENRSKSIVARRAAIDIAEDCSVTALLPLLHAVAAAEDESAHIRSQAIHAVGLIGGPTDVVRLREILEGNLATDESDDMRGNLLSTVFPQLNASAVFKYLTYPKRPSYFGSYQNFLSYEMPRRLRVEDIASALQWFRSHGRELEVPFQFRSLREEILKRAIEHASADRGIAEGISAVIYDRLALHEDALGDESLYERLRSDLSSWRAVLRFLVERIAQAHDKLICVGLAHSGLLQSTDVPWLLLQLFESEGTESEEIWAELVSRQTDFKVRGQYDLVLDAVRRNEALKQRIGDWFQVVDLDSPEADELRCRFEEQQKWIARRDKSPGESPKPTRSEVVEGWLDKFEAGDVSAWWQLNVSLGVERVGDRYYIRNELEPDLTALESWGELSVATVERCLRAASRYLEVGSPDDEQWFGTNTLHRPALAGYRALQLLLKLSPSAIDGIEESTWRKWARVVLAYPETTSDGKTEVLEYLVGKAYEYAPDVVLEALSALIDKESEDHQALFITRKLAACWDRGLVGFVLETAAGGSHLAPAIRAQLLEDALANDGELARKFGIAVLERYSVDDVSREDALYAAAALLFYVPNDSWESIWRVVNEDHDFGRSLFMRFAHRFDVPMGHGKLHSELPEAVLGHLYSWLSCEFPHAEDPQHEEGMAHYVGERESVATFRDETLRALVGRGTNEAVSIVRDLASQMPELDWLRYSAAKARRAALAVQWDPVSVSALARLAVGRDFRLVTTTEQLLDAVMEALARLQDTLHDEKPALDDLWNDDRTPRDEDRISDYVSRYLDRELIERGVVVNREVRIRPGQETDIHVDAIASGVDGSSLATPLRVIVETKGCWHSELKKAMETQLVARYLRRNSAAAGIYLVVWFACDEWSQKDYRLKKSLKWSLQEAQNFFEQQANKLEAEGHLVRSFVLDAALPDRPKRRRVRKQ